MNEMKIGIPFQNSIEIDSKQKTGIKSNQISKIDIKHMIDESLSSFNSDLKKIIQDEIKNIIENTIKKEIQEEFNKKIEEFKIVIKKQNEDIKNLSLTVSQYNKAVNNIKFPDINLEKLNDKLNNIKEIILNDKNSENLKSINSVLTKIKKDLEDLNILKKEIGIIKNQISSINIPNYTNLFKIQASIMQNQSDNIKDLYKLFDIIDSDISYLQKDIKLVYDNLKLFEQNTNKEINNFVSDYNKFKVSLMRNINEIILGINFMKKEFERFKITLSNINKAVVTYLKEKMTYSFFTKIKNIFKGKR